VIIVSGCIFHKKYLKLPEINYIHDERSFKIQGYYYTEKTRNSYCKKELNEAGGYSNAKESKFEEYCISTIVFYSDGYLYGSGWHLHSGITRTIDNYMDYCHLLEEENNYKNTKIKFEENINLGHIITDEEAIKAGIFQRGVYHVDGTQIKIQLYQGGFDYGPHLFEYEGLILNDTSIILKFFKESPEAFIEDIEDIDEIYKFVPFEFKPDSINYIRDNREKFEKKIKY
jgi:hypothetical protein